jgi:hypothetical protein
MKHWFWLALLAPAAQACELPGGAAQKIESPQHTILYRAAPLRVGEHFVSDGEAILKPLKLSEQESQDLVAFLESLLDGGGNYRRRAFAEDCS